MQIKGIIFDLDGTLLHTIEDIAAAANELFRRHGLEQRPLVFYLKLIGNGAKRFIRDAMGGVVEEQLLLERLLEFKEIYEEGIHDKSRIYDGVPALLDQLSERGVKMAVLSNKPHQLTRKACAHFFSSWPLDPVFGQREEIPRKPDPAAAIEIAEIWDLKAEEILFIGDSDNDLLTAAAAGMKALAATWGYGRLTCGEPMDDLQLIGTPSEVLDHLY